jgi:hypothetical protein
VSARLFESPPRDLITTPRESDWVLGVSEIAQMPKVTGARNLGLSKAANIMDEWTFRNAAIDGGESQVWVNSVALSGRMACPLLIASLHLAQRSRT